MVEETVPGTEQTISKSTINPDLERFLDVSMTVSIEIGRAKMTLEKLLNLVKGDIIELDQLSGEPLKIYANNKLIAYGDVISVNGKYGVRVTAVESSQNDS